MKRCQFCKKEFLSQHFKRECRRFTTPRRAIIEFIHSNIGHFSAEEVFKGIKEKYPNIGIATVYRTLALLTRTGIVNRLDFGDGIYRYEINDKHTNKHHHHLICTSCGKVLEYMDFIDEELNLVRKVEDFLSKKYSFSIKGHTMQFYGICAECMNLSSGAMEEK